MTIVAPTDLVQIMRCRSCGSEDLEDLVAFGDTPIADRLVHPENTTPEITAPLTLAFCRNCTLCQIRETLAPRLLFPQDYPYYSSVSPALVQHFRSSADNLIERYCLGPGNLVVEAASNDGYMLSTFHECGIDVLGIDPADGPVGLARKKGIETLHDFFTSTLARDLVAKGRRADLFLANNVLAHVADTNDFVAGIAALLTDEGHAVIEVPYLIDLIDHLAFDTIYHQHLLYLSLTALAPLFERHGIYLNDAERLKVHGGSLRLFVSRRPGHSPGLEKMMAQEQTRGIGSSKFYAGFLARMTRLRTEARAALAAARAAGQRVAGYGAAAKGTTLLHFFGLTSADLDFIVDRSPFKQGLQMPGTKIPIVAPSHLSRQTADVVLVLAWNFANEIIKENRAFTEAGGQFLIPVPEVRLVSDEMIGVSM